MWRRGLQGRLFSSRWLPERAEALMERMVMSSLGLLFAGGLVAAWSATTVGRVALLAEASAASASSASPPLRPAAPVEDESVYDAVELDFISDECPFCKMVKASPCHQLFLKFHRCSEYHQQRQEDFLQPCKNYALGLWTCMQEHKSFFPESVTHASKGPPVAAQDDDEGEEELGKKKL